tara:strand:+ start:171 stop:485 length:315 start_codon:yes stop_codon:yes gene_type:complete
MRNLKLLIISGISLISAASIAQDSAFQSAFKDYLESRQMTKEEREAVKILRTLVKEAEYIQLKDGTVIELEQPKEYTSPSRLKGLDKHLREAVSGDGSGTGHGG